MELGDEHNPRKGAPGTVWVGDWAGPGTPELVSVEVIMSFTFRLFYTRYSLNMLSGPQAASSPVEISAICIDIRTERDVGGC